MIGLVISIIYIVVIIGVYYTTNERCINRLEYYFSKSFKLNSINEGNVIEAFKERIEQYYFEPIEMLNKNEYRFGFASATLLASLIDILAKVENHNFSDYNKHNYKHNHNFSDYNNPIPR